MKKLIFLFSLLSSFYSFGQCVNLYIKEHLDGDPICRLKGNKLEMCFDNRQIISGGDCTFYIQSTRMNGDAQIYEFGLDKTTPYFYAPKYGELIINTATKKLGIQIDDNWGSYSYYNEAEMQKIREFEKIENEKSILEQKQNEEKERQERVRIEKEKQEEDSKLTIQIINYLNENKLSDARYYVRKLNFPEKFPKEYITKLISKEDSVIIVEVSNSLKNGYPIEASLKFKSLSERNDNYSKYYKIISDSLNRKFSKEYVELDATNEIAKNYIIENKSKINLFKDGVHYIQFDQSGQALDLHNGLTNWTKVPQENINGFLIKKASKLKLNISTNSVRIDSQTHASTKRQVFTNKKGKKFVSSYYFYNIFEMTNDNAKIDQNVPRRKYFVIENIKNDKTANSIFIDSKLTEKKIEEGKLHSKFFIRSLISMVIISPFTLRIYENTTVK